MNPSLFTNITFGDIFVTKNNKRVFFVKKRYDNLLEFIVEGNDIPSKYTLNGKIKDEEDSPYDIEYKLNSNTAIETYAQQLSEIETQKWYDSTIAVFDKMTDKEKEEFNPYITFEAFADILAQHIKRAVNSGYNKALENVGKSSTMS